MNECLQNIRITDRKGMSLKRILFIKLNVMLIRLYWKEKVINM